MKRNIFADKLNSLGIKWRTFFYLIIFTGIIVILLWLSQVVFFDDIYKNIRITEIKDCADKIERAIGENDEASAVDDAANDTDICVVVLEIFNNEVDSNIDFNGKSTNRYTLNTVYSYHTENYCVIHSIDKVSYTELYSGAINNGGSQLQRFKVNEKRRQYFGIEGNFFDRDYSKNNSTKVDTDNLPESIIYTRVTENISGNTIMILLNATISPMGSTIRTLNRMLIVITAILIALAMLLATVISWRVSKPLRKLTTSANRLAGGDYTTEFSGTGYKEVKQLSDALNYAQTELSKVDSLRRELIANISHDLRTPLTMISGYSEVMRDIPGENTPENVQVIIDETKRLTDLVNDVLDISQIESGVGKIEKNEFLLTNALKNVLSRFKKLCEKDKYVINFICDGDVWVYADEKRIMQALYNLIGNAVNHTGADKSVTVTQQCLDGKVRISVTDTGEGIEKDQLPYIWDRYYKVDKVHKRSIIGTGLGLSIVKNIMNISGGIYGVTSELGKGSTFYIELPIFSKQTE